jgi:predicted TPR repeat methyltransferase
MTRLYSKWALVYHEMYQSIFDYRKDSLRFQSILKKYHCKSVLELGCGTGMLAPYFLSAGYRYKGLDSSRAMLAIARKQTPEAHFIQADMRRFSLRKKMDAVLVPGRTFSYMTTNQDMLAALSAIHKALKRKGILIFDSFEASRNIHELPPPAERRHSEQRSHIYSTVGTVTGSEDGLDLALERHLRDTPWPHQTEIRRPFHSSLVYARRGASVLMPDRVQAAPHAN